jgi:hypothetical protein
MSKITLVGARDIALDRLVASDANVRRIKAGVSVEDLAEDIARRGLLQSLNVRPEVDGEGAETGRFTVTAGGRRLAALKLLVKQKRLAKNAPVPCIVKVDGIEEEDSLAENTMRGLVARRFRKVRRRRRGIIYATRTKLACPSLRIRLSDLIAIATSVTRRASSRDFKVSPMTRL